MGDMTFHERNQVKWVGSRPAHNGTQAMGSANITDGPALIYLVPVGEVFYFTGYSFTYHSVVGVATGNISIQDVVPAVVEMLNMIQVTDVEYCMLKGSFWPPLELPAGYSVRLWSNAATLFVHGFVHGWVE